MPINELGEYVPSEYQEYLDTSFSSQEEEEQKEFKQSDTSALATTFNSGVALYKRGIYNKLDVDLTKYEGKEFNKETLKASLQEQKYSPSVVEETLSSPVNSWEEAERRAEYVKYLEDSNEQVMQNYSTTGMITAGIPLALLDIDAVLISPTLAGVNKFNKAMNLSSKVSKVASHTIAGSLVGAQSMLTYEASTGVYKDNSLVEAALMGAAIGGTLGTLIERSTGKNLNRIVNQQGNTVAKEEAKIGQVAELNKQREDIESILEQLRTQKDSKKDVKEALKGTRQTDKGKVRFDNTLVVKRLTKDKEKIEADYQANRVEKTKFEEDVKPLKAQLAAVNKQLRDLEKTQVKIQEDTNNVSILTKKTKNLQEAIKEQEARKTAIDRPSGAVKDANAKIEELKLAIKALNGDLEQVNARLNKLDKETPAKINVLKSENKSITKQLADLEAKSKDVLAKDAKLRLQRSETNTQIKRFEKEPKVRDIDKSFETMQLEATLAKYNADSSPAGIYKLLQSKNLIDEDLMKLAVDDFNIKTVTKLRTQKRNIVNKLQDELKGFEDIRNLEDIANAPSVPEWVRKYLLISPVANNSNSLNAAVRGLTNLIQVSTIHQGKANTYTAANLRYMLDTKNKRMVQGVLWNYKQAVKEGYTGKLAEFEKDVMQEGYSIVSDIKVQYFTGVPGGKTGLERVEIANQKTGSISRNYQTSNKWVQQSVDEMLDYYESIHKKGNDLEMAAFMGSLSKGFMPRVYSSSKIEKLHPDITIARQKAISIIVDAQRNFARATGSAIDEAELLGKAETAVDSALTKEARVKRVTEPLGMPKQSSVSTLKQRSIDVFDDDISGLLSDDFSGLSSHYGLQVNGKLAIKERLGVESNEQLEELIQSTGGNTRELDNFRAMSETILGIREISGTPFSPETRAYKFLGSMTSALHIPAFVIPTLTEYASIAKEFGWSKTLDKMSASPVEVLKMYRDGSPSEKNTIEMMLSYGDAHFINSAGRFDTLGELGAADRTQQFLEDLVHKEAIYSGMLPVTDMMKMTTASLTVDFLASMSVKTQISKTDRQRLQDMGFDLEDMPEIKRTLQVQPDGRMLNTDRASWGKLDSRITMGVIETMKRTILHPDGATLPKFMTDLKAGGFVPRLLMKFLRFPVESHERLLIRGIQEADAKQMLAVVGNIAMWTTILSIKDALKDEDKKQYSGEDGMDKLMMDSFIYNSWTGGSLLAGDFVSGALRGENLTNDYKFVPAGAVLYNVKNLQEGKLSVSVPFSRAEADIGEGVANFLQTMEILEEVNKE